MANLFSNLIKKQCLTYSLTGANNSKQKINFNSIKRFLSSSRLSPEMRFIQFARKDGCKRLGVVSDDGKSLIDLSTNESIPKDMKSFLNGDTSKMLKTVQDFTSNKNSFEPITSEITILPPIDNPQKIICIGLNYKDHCEEQNKAPPKEPMFFSKFNNTLVGANDNVIRHKITNKLDWEVELAVIIGREAKHVSTANAMDYVFGFSVAQDISARDWQKERNGGQFLIGKSMDTFCPLGHAIVHKSLVGDVNNLSMKTCINGVEKQNGNTGQMIFKIEDIIERLTESITLTPGDVILTGTPKGVGMHRNPPEYLKAGDVIETEIESIGKLVNHVVEGC